MRELHELLRHYAGSEQRYKDLVQSMRNSTLTAFYTPPAIVRALAEALRDAGVVPRRLLDPSAGAGIFPSSFRETADGEVEIGDFAAFHRDLRPGRQQQPGNGRDKRQNTQQDTHLFQRRT